MIEAFDCDVTERRIAEQRIFGTDTVEIGRFEVRPDDPRFRFSGPPGRYCFVLPETAVEIRHEGRSAFVSNVNTVTFYNPEDEYRRWPVDPRGDFCTWIAFDPEMVSEAVGRCETGSFNGFRHPFGPSDNESFLAGRRLLQAIRRSRHNTDQLVVEEAAAELLTRVVTLAYQSRQAIQRRQAKIGSNARRQRRRLLRKVLVTLGEDCSDRWTLSELSRRVGCSPFHLSRLFRQETGSTLHAYLTQLRIRRAADLIGSRDLRLCDIAAEVGFASHSHMSSHFQKVLGCLPSELRPSS